MPELDEPKLLFRLVLIAQFSFMFKFEFYSSSLSFFMFKFEFLCSSLSFYVQVWVLQFKFEFLCSSLLSLNSTHPYFLPWAFLSPCYKFMLQSQCHLYWTLDISYFTFLWSLQLKSRNNFKTLDRGTFQNYAKQTIINSQLSRFSVARGFDTRFSQVKSPKV